MKTKRRSTGLGLDESSMPPGLQKLQEQEQELKLGLKLGLELGLELELG